MTVNHCKPSSRKGKQTPHNTKHPAKKQVSPLRQRMIRDMELAGLTRGTQQNYIRAVVMLQDHYTIRQPRSSWSGMVYARKRLFLGVPGSSQCPATFLTG